MDCENWLLKVGQVGHFGAAAAKAVGRKDLL